MLNFIGKLVSISEASIRTDLLFHDADGTDTLTNQAIFDAIQLMGYEGDLTVLTFNKALFSPQWRHLEAKKKIEEEDEFESEDDDIPQVVKKFKQLESDEEMARKIQEEWEEEEERNKIAEEKATNEALIKNFDDIKARIEADRILAEKLQEQEREQFTIEERAKFLHDTIAAQRKFLA
ncbi:hypothetical protein Tco_0622569, partial [Tanacetum coccineum]